MIKFQTSPLLRFNRGRPYRLDWVNDEGQWVRAFYERITASNMKILRRYPLAAILVYKHRIIYRSSDSFRLVVNHTAELERKRKKWKKLSPAGRVLTGN